MTKELKEHLERLRVLHDKARHLNRYKITK